MKYTDQQIEELLQGIYSGKYTNKKLPEDLYFAIADYLKKGLYNGFGSTINNVPKADLELLTELRDNVYMFSAAKTYSQVVQMRDFLADSENFKQFYERALTVYDQYNKVWAETEYETCIGQAQSAVKWSEFVRNKEVLPNLRYSAIGDACDICAPLNGIVAPVDAPIWATCAPLNHFRCLCLLEATDEDETKIDPEIIAEVEEQMQDIFKMNPGTDGYIFKNSHPYFEVAPGDRGLAALNFNLPMPEDD